MRIKFIGLIGIVVLLAGACGDSSSDTTAADTAETVAAEPVDAPGFVDVMFDGQGCSVEDVSELPAGDHSFVLTNEVGTESIPVYVVKLIDGHTYQDLVDIQTSLGGPPTFMPMPEWAVAELRSFDLAGISLAENQHEYAYSLEEGAHAVYVRLATPSAIHLCAPLNVVLS